MSGIYIPGMEIPQNCSACLACKAQLVRNDDGIVSGVAYACALTCKTTDGSKLEDCSLIPVPDHGRLIDADALEKWFVEWYDLKADLSILHFLDILKDEIVAPTIIPADKEYA